MGTEQGPVTPRQEKEILSRLSKIEAKDWKWRLALLVAILSDVALAIYTLAGT